MSPRSSTTSYGIKNLATLLICRYRINSGSIVSIPGYQNMSDGTTFSKFGYGIGSSINQTLSISSGDSIKRPKAKMGQEETSKVQVQPSDPDPPRPNIFTWIKWVLGSIIPLTFSFWKQKWNNMLKLEGKVEEVVTEAEEVAEVIEKVASKTEKLSAEVAEKLDNGELKQVVLMVEHASSVIAKDAQMTEAFVHKVGDLKQDLTDLETMVEPVIDKIEHKK